MPPRQLAASLVCLLTLAGCSEPAAEPAAETPSLPVRLELTDCQGWKASSLPFPAGTGPGEAPSGWGMAEAATFVHMEGYECDRLSLGRFERGPVRIVLDMHTAASGPPPACGTDGNEWRILGSLWVDDKEVAQDLDATLGLPARFSPIAESVQPAGPGQLRTWSWGEGPAASSVIVPQDGLDVSFPGVLHVFWPRDEGIGRLSLEFHGRIGAFVNRPVVGTMQPPMLMGAMPGGLFAGAGFWYPALSAEGSFALYADGTCADPEETGA